MPTYRYECNRCDAVHEAFQSMSEEPLKKCPECGGKLTRLIGAGGGVILKGSGFYTTDYRSESYKSDAKKDAPPSSGSEKKSSDSTAKKSDSKPSKKD